MKHPVPNLDHMRNGGGKHTQPEPERVREEMHETVRELTDELESIESLEHPSTGTEPPLFKK
jgi:hypothetical protein